MLLVFGPSGGGDGAQLAARQRGLEQIGCVAGASRATGADEGMRLVDEQDDRHFGRLHLVDHGFQAFLEFAFHRCTGLHQSHVKHANADALQ